MASNNNNNKLREELTKLQKKVRLVSDNTMNELKKILCEVWKCDDNKELILINGVLPGSRIDEMEERLDLIESVGAVKRVINRRNRRNFVLANPRRGGTRCRRRKKRTRRRRKSRRKKNRKKRTKRRK